MSIENYKSKYPLALGRHVIHKPAGGLDDKTYESFQFHHTNPELLPKALDIINANLKRLQELIDAQVKNCDDGKEIYMTGVANGLICAFSIITNNDLPYVTPKFKTDNAVDSAPIVVGIDPGKLGSEKTVIMFHDGDPSKPFSVIPGIR
jgi:hypothetical protein